MTKRQYIIYTIEVLALLLAGCAREVPEIKEEKAEITFNANVSGMREGARINSIDNTALQTLANVKIDAYYSGTDDKYLDGVKLHYTGGDPTWVFWDGSAQLHYYWPFEGSKTAGGVTASTLDFVGFCPFDKPTYIGTPTYSHSTGVSFTCDMSGYMTLASQSTMQEYVVAVLNEQTLATQTAAPGGALPLQFKHPLALIKFTITAASGTSVQVNSISIAGLYTTATCTYNGSTMNWGSYDDETKAAMTITQTLKNGGTTVSTPFAVIPNNYGSKYLTVNATWDEWSDVTISDYGTNVDFNWEPGRIYTYNLTLDKYGLKVDVTKFTEQW